MFAITASLYVEIGHEFCVLLDKFATKFGLLAHEDGEELVRFDRVFHRNFQERTFLRIHGGFPKLFGVHLAKTFVALKFTALSAELVVVCFQTLVVVEILLLLALCDLVKRRKSDKYVAVFNERTHEAEKEGEHQNTNVAAVHIGIGHANDTIVAEL